MSHALLGKKKDVIGFCTMFQELRAFRLWFWEGKIMMVLWVLQSFIMASKDSQFMGAKWIDEVDINLF